MKMFWVIFKGFMIIWVFLFPTLSALALAFLEVETAVIAGGIVSAITTGVIVWFIVRTKAEKILRANPHLRRPPKRGGSR